MPRLDASNSDHGPSEALKPERVSAAAHSATSETKQATHIPVPERNRGRSDASIRSTAQGSIMTIQPRRAHGPLRQPGGTASADRPLAVHDVKNAQPTEHMRTRQSASCEEFSVITTIGTKLQSLLT